MIKLTSTQQDLLQSFIKSRLKLQKRKGPNRLRKEDGRFYPRIRTHIQKVQLLKRISMNRIKLILLYKTKIGPTNSNYSLQIIKFQSDP